MTDSSNLADGLRRWGATKGDDSVRAAVELLIEHDHWLWDEGFTGRCIRDERGVAYIDFAEVRRYHDEGAPCSESQAAILLVIADIGTCRWQIPTMDGRNRRRIVRAVTRAAGMAPDA